MGHQINQKGITSEKPSQMLSTWNVFLFKSLSFSYYHEVKTRQYSSHIYHLKLQFLDNPQTSFHSLSGSSRLNQNYLQVAHCSDLGDAFIFCCAHFWKGDTMTK